MTMPNERRWAVENTGRFLVDLLNPKQTPRVPSDIRKEASRCLRHYPLKYHMELAAEQAPQVFGDWDAEFRDANKEASKKPEPDTSNVTLKLSGESMDALFVDLLNDNLELILNPDVKFIHPDDYGYNLTLADAIMTLMNYQKDAFAFDKWCADMYMPMLDKYQEKYEELTSKED